MYTPGGYWAQDIEQRISWRQQQRILASKAHGPQTHTEVRGAQRGAVVSSTQPDRVEMRLWGKAAGEQGRSVSRGWGRVWVRVGLSHRVTKATMVVVFAYNTAACMFFQSQATETGSAIKYKIILSICPYWWWLLYIWFFCLSLAQTIFLSTFYWIITYGEKSARD